MLIDSAGKYLTREGKVADIVRVDRTTAVGRMPDSNEALVWDINTGEALGHPLVNSLVGKQRNLPAVAQQVVKILRDLDTNQQRLQVANIFRQQVCLECGNVPEPGLPCPCKTPAQKPSGKRARKTVH
jgi:hypothetical protein